MYQPPHFREDRLDVQHGLIRAHPLGMLVTNGSAGLVANPLPFVLDASASPLGTLKAHLSRANGQWRDVDPGQEALAIFQGVEAYFTSSWYETKRETGKVVPTWNYAVVQAYGRPRIVEDPDWLMRQIRELTAAQEAARPEPWAVDDAPAPFIAAQLKGIVGIEIEQADNRIDHTLVDQKILPAALSRLEFRFAQRRANFLIQGHAIPCTFDP